MSTPAIAFAAADTDEAQSALAQLSSRYPSVPLERADVVVALGGDGFMLETLHRSGPRGLPIYGMNRGTVGFLMNRYDEDDLPARLQAAHIVRLHPLRMSTRDIDGHGADGMAINEVSLLRQSRQAAKIAIHIDGKERLPELIADGVLVATPAGSTAYNLSAHGPILPIGSPLLALTPISAFRPRRWRGALLPHSAEITFLIQEPQKRPVSAVADATEVRNVTEVRVHEDRNTTFQLLFNPDHNLEERILLEQFTP